jgi:selenide, water dikinase
VPRDKLLSLLRGAGLLDNGAAGDGHNPQQQRGAVNETPGMDCSVVATRHSGLFSVSTTDFFYPNVEDPFVMGRVAACNVLSDIYATGIVNVDTVLMILAVSMDMAENERDAVTSRMIAGFVDACTQAGARVTGGQTIQNPWPIIGGVATSIVTEKEMIRPGGALSGDVLVLTKPLGTQVAANLWQWRGGQRGRHWEKIKNLLVGYAEDPSTAVVDPAKVYNQACKSMASLNLCAAQAMHKFNAHAATDVTGFGILGHSDNLAQHSDDENVRFELTCLPCIKGTLKIEDTIGGAFRLRLGLSAETSGGLLVALAPDSAAGYIQELALNGINAWIVGRVVTATKDDIQPEGQVYKRSMIIPGAEYIDVE